jgi:Icc-related predicted phosphoesterase
MTLLAVSDLHFGLTQFDWLVQEAPRHDAVIIAGDLLDISGHLELDDQILVVSKYLRRISEQTRLLVCSGNHDGDAKNEHQEYVARWLQRVRAEGLVVDGGSCEVGGATVSVCPWWDGPKTQETMRAFLHQERARALCPWIWVHHAPPDGARVSWTGKGHAGDASLATLIHELEPDYVFSGHIHQSPFCAGGTWVDRMERTWSFNPGKQLGAPPAHIVLDLSAHIARWSSQAGEEQINLQMPAAQPISLA